MAGPYFRIGNRSAAIVAAMAVALGATPVAAQMTDGFNFLKAVKERDGTEATRFLNEHGSVLVNARDGSSGETALLITVRRRDAVWTRFMLDRGANPNAADKKGVTPLSAAVALGFTEGAEQLLKKGARTDVSNDTGETPLITAIHRRDAPMARLLLAHGADPDRPDNSGRSARDYARLMGNASAMLTEIERADATRKDAGGAGLYGPAI
ncbi:ankyrin repeat domain-containing protein [Altererythrobacter aerius]|uniref:Ankyrin repeat domain-containing protein n=1 Tax=Tsuneonella aeria TaxID=1837929 RepID=A0A6I4TDB8_9SPHN|nr:ankyrin repeat domain-containing protein [Tsuneonella aeria]MXO75053.1 ankyrin repeat domain-containing protein [Tsuneonella aeria]